MRYHLSQNVTHKDIQAAHMPSSARRFKTNATLENQEKKGGAQVGHPGHGRKKASGLGSTILRSPENCPDCHLKLSPKGTKTRTVVEVHQIKAERTILGLERGQCPQCRKVFQPPLPVLPKSLYGNRLLAQAAVMHYLHGISMGRLLDVFGPEVTEGGLIQAFHRLGAICEKAFPRLTQAFRTSPVRQADETGWRTDGHSGYAWIFLSDTVTLFQFRETRSSRVAAEIFGSEPLPGVLIVDRYAGYNRLPVSIQYCYAHLLREVEKLQEEFEDSPEIERFVPRMALSLTHAMKLRGLGLSPLQFLSEAKSIQTKILQEVHHPYTHLAIRRIQQIFKKHKDRLYHWAQDPRIPADNNRAEREIRPTVMARKVSFGSQSKKGAATRSHVMSLLATAKKQLKDLPPENWLYQALNQIALHPLRNIADLLPTPP